MRRRPPTNTSSLDLFLDTICNTFGGIVFLAILLSVLMQMRSKQPQPLDPSDVPMSAEDYHDVVAKFDDLTAARQQLSDLVVDARSRLPTSEDLEIQEAQRQAEQEQQRLESAIEQHTEFMKQLAQQLEDNAKIAEETQEVSRRLTEAQASLERDQAALEEALSDKLEILKLPRVETINKSNEIILMRYGRIYPLRVGAGQDLNGFDLVITKLSGDNFTAAPRADKGWSLPSDISELATHIGQYAPTRRVFSVIVWPDSFAEFALLKEVMIEAGFQYELLPITDMAACPFGKSSRTPQVQ